jgi:hypothetical protein
MPTAGPLWWSGQPIAPGAPATDADRLAARSHPGVLVSCFVRASLESFPQKWKQGGLILDEGGARWVPGIRVRTLEARSHSDGGLPLPTSFRSLEMIEPKRWSKFGTMLVEGRRVRPFQIIRATSAMGDVFFAVPRDSVVLVVEHLGPERDA